MRERMFAIPVIEFEESAYVTPPPLERACVAIVTTSGLSRPGEKPWEHGETAFRTLAREERNLIVSHISPNFDRTGVAADLNVVYPIDRLEELAAEGVIGAVADRHISFQGAVADGVASGAGGENQLRTIQLDTGPAAARLLRAEGVDVAILTPV